MSKSYNVWFCHPYASAPGKGQSKLRSEYFLVNEMIKLGHKVSMVTASVEHINGTKVEMKNKKVDFEVIENIPYVWLKNKPYEGNGLGRILNMSRYARYLKKYFKIIAKESGTPDIVLCSAMPAFHYNACKKIADYYKAKLIFQVRDIWPLAIIETLGVPKYHPLCLYVGYTEKKAYKQADAVVSVLDNAKDYMVSRGLRADKYNWISNGYQPLDIDTSNFDSDNDLNNLRALKLKGNFLIGYTGAIGIPNNLEILCQAVSELDSNYHLILMGNGQIKQSLQHKFKDCLNIHFLGHKPKKLIPLFLKTFDVCYLSVQHLPTLYKMGLSANKGFEYLYHEKPVICPNESHYKLFKNDSANLMYDISRPVESLKKVITLANELSDEELKKIGSHGKEIIEKSYLYSTLVKKYDMLFNKLYSSNKRKR